MPERGKDENERLEFVGACDQEREVRIDCRDSIMKGSKSLPWSSWMGGEVGGFHSRSPAEEATSSECDKQELEAGETTLQHESYVPRLKQLSPTAFSLYKIVKTTKKKKKKKLNKQNLKQEWLLPL